MSSSKQNIVVVGGGGAGTAIARQLSQKLPSLHSGYNVILVTHREAHVHQPAAIRMLVTADGNLENNAVIPYDSLFPNKSGTIKLGKVVGIEKNTSEPGGDVLLESGEKIPFRYLVLATGSLWEGPFASLRGTKQDLLSAVLEWREKFRKSRAVVIVGAGAVGLEFAGEVRDLYPNKEITIVNVDPLPLNDAYPEKFRKDILRRWRKRGVKFILEDRIDDVPEGEFSTITTRKGQKVNADLVVLARGPKPNTEFLTSLGSNVLDERGFVRVTPTLQLPDHPDIFAAGDIIAFNEQKQLAKLPGHVSAIVANLFSLITGKQPKKNYQGTFEGIVITDGKEHGAGFVDTLWGITMGDKLVPMLKGKELFVKQARVALGLTT